MALGRAVQLDQTYVRIIETSFSAEGERARMMVTLHPHIDPHWTQMSIEGFSSQLKKLDSLFGS